MWFVYLCVDPWMLSSLRGVRHAIHTQSRAIVCTIFFYFIYVIIPTTYHTCPWCIGAVWCGASEASALVFRTVGNTSLILSIYLVRHIGTFCGMSKVPNIRDQTGMLR